MTPTVMGFARDSDAPELASTREWLVTNGIGGYASGTLSGVVSRRYHGLLVAALPNPLGRTMMLNQLIEWVTLADGQEQDLSGHGAGGGQLASFRLEMGLPVWSFEAPGIKLEKRLVMPNGQNTVCLLYRLLDGQAACTLHLRPAIQVRPHDASVSSQMPTYTVALTESRCEILPGQSYPPLRMFVHGDSAAFIFEPPLQREVDYLIEAARGYDSRGSLWSRGRFDITLQPGHEVALVASTESWDVLLSLDAQDIRRYELERRKGLLARLRIGRGHVSYQATDTTPVTRASHKQVATMDPIDEQLALAADQFVISPVGRTADATRARASGEDLRSVIAGYHWFTDWGRDTMISLEGLCLVTGRHRIARFILRTFARYVKQGLIPNLFPEGSHEGLYHTADATLWFFHAIGRYLVTSGDEELIVEMMPLLQGIVRHHIEGTRFGIRVDAKDGLLTQGQEGYQLTWMDAKCGDWVVTPRRGKAVEINALWFNALSLMNEWAELLGKGPRSGELKERAEQARASFNKRFWSEELGYLYDVIDGPEIAADNALRPNQIFAVSLPHPVLDEAHWRPVLEKVEATLLTPYGLRSLAPGSKDYQKTYHGDLRTRDSAYHQGTVWTWLIGPYVDALLRVEPTAIERAKKALDGLSQHLGQACIGQICEVFDAEEPYRPRGCAAQAWGVGELLRARSVVAAQEASLRSGDVARTAAASTASAEAPRG